MANNKRTEFFFAVGNPEDKRSNVWRIISSKNDIYLMSDSFKSSYKIALHQSGTCQSEFISEFWATTGLPNKERFLDRWEIKYKEGEAAIAFKIAFPYNQLAISNDNIQQTSKDINYIPKPQENHCIEVIVYKTGVYTDSLNAHIPQNYNVIYCFQLYSGEMVVVMYCEKLLSEEQRSQIQWMTTFAKEKKEKCGIHDRVIASAFSLVASNGERELVEIYV